MNLPNGFGSVYKLSGKRRRPWVARKTTGWTFDEDKGKSYPIYEFIGYYTTRAEALTALTDYNKDPYDLKSNVITFAEVYEKWTEEHFPKIGKSNIYGIKASYNLCDSIKDLKFAEIKLAHLQKVVNESGKNAPILKKLKIMFGMMWDWAVINEIVTQDKREIIRYIDISQAGNPNAIERKPFSKKEMKKLWDNVDRNDRFQIPLILIYTGLRISEFWNLKKVDVHLDEKWFFVEASKTESGIREVPIADKILPFFEHWMSSHDSEYVFPTARKKKYTDKVFRESLWTPLMEELEMSSHKPHDTRHTCVSLLTQAGVDERIIKKIVGHKGQGVTQAVYMHLDMEAKLEAINKI